MNFSIEPIFNNSNFHLGFPHEPPPHIFNPVGINRGSTPVYNHNVQPRFPIQSNFPGFVNSSLPGRKMFNVR